MPVMEREPFTKPLTSGEVRYIKERIDQVLRENGKHILKNNGTQRLDYEREVEEALEFFNRMTPKMLARMNQGVEA